MELNMDHMFQEQEYNDDCIMCSDSVQYVQLYE